MYLCTVQTIMCFLHERRPPPSLLTTSSDSDHFLSLSLSTVRSRRRCTRSLSAGRVRSSSTVTRGAPVPAADRRSASSSTRDSSVSCAPPAFVAAAPHTRPAGAAGSAPPACGRGEAESGRGGRTRHPVGLRIGILLTLQKLMCCTDSPSCFICTYSLFPNVLL